MHLCVTVVDLDGQHVLVKLPHDPGDQPSRLLPLLFSSSRKVGHSHSHRSYPRSRQVGYPLDLDEQH